MLVMSLIKNSFLSLLMMSNGSLGIYLILRIEAYTFIISQFCRATFPFIMRFSSCSWLFLQNNFDLGSNILCVDGKMDVCIVREIFLSDREFSNKLGIYPSYPNIKKLLVFQLGHISINCKLLILSIVQDKTIYIYKEIILVNNIN